MKRLINLFLCSTLCVALFAQATDLVIDNQTPGWLSSKIAYADQEAVRNLKVTGYINSTDLNFIGTLLNKNLNGGRLDLSDANIVGTSKKNYMGTNCFGIRSFPKLQYLSFPKTLVEASMCLQGGSNGLYYYVQVDTLVFEPDDITYAKATFFDKSQNGKSMKNIVLGENIDSIPDGAFSEQSNLESVFFKGKIKYVGRRAFSSTQVKSVNMEALVDVEHLDYKSFDCPLYLDTLYVPSHFETYHESSFNFNDNAHIFFSENLKELRYKYSGDVSSYSASFGRKGILHIHFKTTTPPRVEHAFNAVSYIIHVPKGTASVYKSSYNFAGAEIIEDNPLEKLSIDNQHLLIEKGGTQQIPITLYPINADDKRIYWSTENCEIISVDVNGVVTGISPGTSKVYAMSPATGLKDSCTVTVVQHVESITVSPTKLTLYELGETKQLDVAIFPVNATDKSVTWSSTDPSVCAVTPSGVVVAIGYGQAVIMATTNDGNIPATCVVKITPPQYKLTYLIDGKEYFSSSFEEGSTIPNLTIPTKEGYTFSGWSNVPTTMPAEDVTVTGTFIVNQYTITYYVNNKVWETDTYGFGAAVTLRTYEPSESRYTFTAWEEEAVETMPAHNLEYHATLADDIVQIGVDPKATMDVYTLTGVKVLSATPLKDIKVRLPHGIYIIGGQKVRLK